MANATDIIRFQVIWNNLISIVEEQARTLMRTAFSPVGAMSPVASSGARPRVTAVTLQPGTAMRFVSVSWVRCFLPSASSSSGSP